MKTVIKPDGSLEWYRWRACHICTEYGVEDVTLCGEWVLVGEVG